MEPFLELTAKRFAEQVPAVNSWSLRLVSERKESLAVRQDIVQPPDILVGGHLSLSSKLAGRDTPRPVI